MNFLLLIGLISLRINPELPYKINPTSLHSAVRLTVNPNFLGKSGGLVQDVISTDHVTFTDKTYFEDGIEEVIVGMFSTKNLKPINNKISLIDSDMKMTKQSKNYWKAYLLYNQSLYYKGMLKDESEASKSIDIAIETLEKSLMTSDDYALLAACKSFSIQFASITQLAKISGEVTEDANKSTELNSKNIRAFYVLASNNFYTPKMFGGMIKVEEYCLKGLACPNSLDGGYYSPYWGKPKIYALYIKFLESENRKEEAQKYRAVAKKDFPGQF